MKNPARRDALLFVLLFALLAAGGGGAYVYFSGSSRAEEAAPAPAPRAGPAEVRPAASVPVVASPPGAAQASAPAAAAPVTEPAPVPAVAEPAPAIAPPEAPSDARPDAPPSPPPPPTPSARFVRYAETIRVSGVFQGNPARALVGGRLVRAGEIIEPALGVSFVGVDAATKHLILEESGGAQLRVRY